MIDSLREIICGTCGSREVGRDSWALWNIEAQEWECGPVFDHAMCFACDAETRLIERVVQPEPTA